MPDQDRFSEIKRCLALADQAFARAGACEDEHERFALIDEAERWLLAAERAFGRLTDRMGMGQQSRPWAQETRSFAEPPPAEPDDEDRRLLWRRPGAPRR